MKVKTKHIARSAVAVLLLFLIGEIVLRFAFYEQLKTFERPQIFMSDSLFGYVYAPNSSAIISRPSLYKEFQTNSHGFYGPDFPTVPEDSSFRIAIVGNSTSEGIDFNGKDNYPVLLEKKLHEAGFKNVEIINCALGGVDRSMKNYWLIKKKVVNFKPDIILFNEGLHFYDENEHRENYKGYILRHNNTLSSIQYTKDIVDEVESMHFFTFLYDYSFMFRAYCKKFYENNICRFTDIIRVYREKNADSPDILKYQYSLKTSTALMKNLIGEFEDLDCRLIPFIMHNDTSYTDIMSQNEIYSLRLDVHFTPEMAYEFDGHPNEYGQEVIAQHFYDKIIESGLISK